MADDELAHLDELIRTLVRRRKHPIEVYSARPEDLTELEEKLGAPLPAPVRGVLERCEGSRRPLSPMRPDRLMGSFEIKLQLEFDASVGVVPLIECDLDPETGLRLGYGVAIANPWGLLKERSEDGFIDADFTLVEWFAMISKELTTYDWPTPRTITVLDEWVRRDAIDEAELVAAPVGTAVATRVITTKRNRVALELCVLVDPGRWVRSISRAEKDNDDSPLIDLCRRSTEEMSYSISRHPSQWALDAAGVVASIRPKRQLFVGAARIE